MCDFKNNILIIFITNIRIYNGIVVFMMLLVSGTSGGSPSLNLLPMHYG